MVGNDHINESTHQDRRQGQNSEKAAPSDQSNNQSVGAVAVTAPNEPNMIIQPLTSATRSLGNQVTMDLSPAIKEPATPNPIMARPTRSSGKLDALPNSVAPPAAMTSRHALDSPRTEAIQKGAYGNLNQSKDQKVDRSKQAQLGGIEPKIGRQRRRDRGINRPKKVGR